LALTIKLNTTKVSGNEVNGTYQLTSC
jgi:hypothetical protein